MKHNTVVWFSGDDYDYELEWAIRLALGPLDVWGCSCWEYDPRRRAIYMLFNFERDEYATARLWIKQAFGDDVKIQQQSWKTPGAHE